MKRGKKALLIVGIVVSSVLIMAVIGAFNLWDQKNSR